MNKLKVGVLTFHRCINYGSYWQALSLVNGIRARGHEAVLLEHYSRKVNIAEWKCALQPVLPTPVPPGDRPLYRQKMKAFFEAFEKLPCSAPFPLHAPEEMEPCDLVVVGSDEVWNLAHPWYNQSPIFFGEGLQTPMLVSYAASFGNYEASWGLEADWAERLRNFDLISVRDYNAAEIVRNSVGIEPDLVLDPCLQFPQTPDAANMINLPQRYIAVYGHNFSPAFANLIRRYAARVRLPLISIGYRNDWADEQWITAGPDAFAHFMQGATAVVTNFFHGCVFALRYARPFACTTTQYRNIKIHALMQKVGGLQHLLNDQSTDADVAALLEAPPAAAILKQIDTLRGCSNAFLDKALGLQQYQYA